MTLTNPHRTEDDAAAGAWLTVNRFMYRPADDRMALLRLIGALEPTGKVAGSAALVVWQGGLAAVYRARETRRGGRGRMHAWRSPALYQASFEIPLHVVEAPDTRFMLAAEHLAPVDLPAPKLTALPELETGRGHYRERWTWRCAVALVAGFGTAAAVATGPIALATTAPPTADTTASTVSAARVSTDAPSVTTDATTTTAGSAPTTATTESTPTTATTESTPSIATIESAATATTESTATTSTETTTTDSTPTTTTDSTPTTTTDSTPTTTTDSTPTTTTDSTPTTTTDSTPTSSTTTTTETTPTTTTPTTPVAVPTPSTFGTAVAPSPTTSTPHHGTRPASTRGESHRPGSHAILPVPRSHRPHEIAARRRSQPAHPAAPTAGRPATPLTVMSDPLAIDPFTAAQIAHFESIGASLDQPPSYLIPIYRAAGQRYHVPWQILAAINAIETDYGRDLTVSVAGAIGWMQVEPGTWSQYGVSVDGSGAPNPYDPKDAIFSAARYLAANGARNNMREALFAYNHALWYVDAVLWRAQLITGDGLSHLGPTAGYALPLDARYMQTLGRTDDGVDIETAPDGAAVYSITPGIVTAVASDLSGFGPNYPVILVTAGPLAGQYIYYGHVAASLVVVGQHVLAGQPIAVMGHTGNAASLGHGHIEIGFSDGSGDPLNHGGAVAWTPAGDAMRRVLDALAQKYQI